MGDGQVNALRRLWIVDAINYRGGWWQMLAVASFEARCIEAVAGVPVRNMEVAACPRTIPAWGLFCNLFVGPELRRSRMPTAGRHAVPGLADDGSAKT